MNRGLAVTHVCSGCSTFLKTIAGETDGFFISKESHINYQGIPNSMMRNDFRGECMYQAEVDVHFPQLTVSQTLEFAARARVGFENHILARLRLTQVGSP